MMINFIFELIGASVMGSLTASIEAKFFFLAELWVITNASPPR